MKQFRAQFLRTYIAFQQPGQQPADRSYHQAGQKLPSPYILD